MLKGSTWIVLVWSQLEGDTYHKMIGLREGQERDNEGGSRDKGFINAHKCFVRALNA